MSKLTWKNLETIFEGTYGVTADEAAKWISKELFSKNWFGTPDKIGRMWEDVENCISFGNLLTEIEKFQKENNYKRGVAIRVMHKERHAALRGFGADIKHGVFGMSAARLENLIGQWEKQLREVGFLKPKKQTAYQIKMLREAAARLDRRLKKEKLLIKKRKK